LTFTRRTFLEENSIVLRRFLRSKPVRTKNQLWPGTKKGMEILRIAPCVRNRRLPPRDARHQKHAPLADGLPQRNFSVIRHRGAAACRLERPLPSARPNRRSPPATPVATAVEIVGIHADDARRPGRRADRRRYSRRSNAVAGLGLRRRSGPRYAQRLSVGRFCARTPGPALRAGTLTAHEPSRQSLVPKCCDLLPRRSDAAPTL
jgi:hypothetical protein